MPYSLVIIKEALDKSFDKLRTNGKGLIPLVVSLSSHGRNQPIQRLLKGSKQIHRVYIQRPADFFNLFDAVDVGYEFCQ
jgi:hypothetical protein